MKIKAAFFDIDGTLVSFQTHAMPASTVQALRTLRTAGVKTFLSTGRNGDSTRFLMETGLFDGEILINGQLCELDGRCIYENPICASDLEAAIASAQAGETTLGFLGGHTSFVSRTNDYVIAACRYAGMSLPPIAPVAQVRSHPVYQIHCYGAPGAEDALLRRTRQLVAVRWSPNFADVFSRGGGKDRGMAAFCAQLNISPEETIAFGDGENDISMLQYAKIGVAMGNASQRVKDSADYVTDAVDDDGIARAIEHFQAYFV